MRFEGKAYIQGGEVTLNFGRHRGEILRDVATDYLIWMIDESIGGFELESLVEDELEARGVEI